MCAQVISMAGARLSLSMKEVDQETGEDLNPERGHEAQVCRHWTLPSASK